jgi:hypothetical protein
LGHFSPGWITPKDRDSSSAKHEVAWDVTRKNIVREKGTFLCRLLRVAQRQKEKKEKKIN